MCLSSKSCDHQATHRYSLLLRSTHLWLSFNITSLQKSTIINRKLQDTPDDPTWLFGKGYASIQTKSYDDAITTLTHLLSIQTTNNDALFNRAVAYLQSDKLDDARADYEKLGQTFTNSFQVAYGLGEIAWRKHETNEAIKNYQAYLTTANNNSAEATNIIQRLRALRGQTN